MLIISLKLKIHGLKDLGVFEAVIDMAEMKVGTVAYLCLDPHNHNRQIPAILAGH